MPLGGYAAFRRIVWAAFLSALITGVLITPLELATTVPLIAQAEVYERNAMAAPAALSGLHPVHAGGIGEMHVDHHRASGYSHWEPEEGFERTAYTALTTTLAAFGYALLLGAALSLAGAAALRAGLTLGVAGFVVFQLAPALGLPPEPPGVPVAVLLPRQLWWLGTVAATALGLACWYFASKRSRPLWIAAGVVLLILPHLIGTPHVSTEAPVVPDELVRRFSLTALFTAALFWLVLGGAMGYVYGKLATRPAHEAA